MKKSNDIIIINQDSGYLMIDLANSWNGQGKNVTLVTGRLIERNNKLSKEIRLKKIIKYDRSSTVKRLFTWGWGTIQILFYAWFRCRKKELWIVSNPPFAPLLPLFLKNKFSLLIYDVYPDVLTEFGILSKKSIIVKKWEKANYKVFKKAERIVTLTEGMKSLLSAYGQPDKIEVIPIWTDNQFLKPIPKTENRFIINNNFQGKFLVMYSGNLGKTHDIEVITELAEYTTDKEIIYLIIGEGHKKELINNRIKVKNLQNCLLMPYQKAEDIPFSFSAADIGIITLGKDASKLSIPSKTYNLMSVGAPLLCIANEESELNNLVIQHELGKCFNKEKIDQMLNFILKLKTDQSIRNKFSNNSLNTSNLFGKNNIQKFTNI